MKNVKALLFAALAGITLMGLSFIGNDVSAARTVNMGSLKYGHTGATGVTMKVRIRRQDNRFAANKVMLPFDTKLTNHTNKNVRFYFTQLYNEASFSNDYLTWNKRVKGPHRNVVIKAHSTKTVKAAFYENDQTIVGWTQPDSYGTLHYGKKSKLNILFYVYANKKPSSTVSRRLNQHKYYYRYS